MTLFFQDLRELSRLPRASVNLLYSKTGENDPFYGRIIKNFYNEANSRHPFWFLVKKFEYGFTLCELPQEFDRYYMAIEAAARRNHKKAARLGYTMRRFEFNDHLEDIRQIWLSTPVRQGEPLPEDIREGRVEAVKDPPSRSPYHDYPYFGVMKDGKVLAYAGCLIAGELCNLNDLYGHHHYQNDGIVPMLIIEIARTLMTSYPSVKYFSYGMYFGASESMRRFKRKFLFNPYHVKWVLGESEPDGFRR